MNAPARPAEEVQTMAALGWRLDRDGDYILPTPPSRFILAPYWDEFQSVVNRRLNQAWTFLPREDGCTIAFDDPVSAAIYLAIEQSNN